MRVLQFVPVYKPAWRYGGPVRSVSKLSEGLAADGHDVTVVTTNANGKGSLPCSTEGSTYVNGVKVFYCARTPCLPYIESFQLRRLVGPIVAEADVIQLSSMWQPLGLSVSKAAIKANRPYVYSLRGGINDWTWTHRELKHKLYWRIFEHQQLSKATALHVTCEAERDDVLSTGIGHNQKFIVVPNCIDSAEYARNPDLGRKFRELHGITDSKHKLMLYLGRLHPKKGIELSIQAAAQPLRESADWHYIIAGPSDQHYRYALEELIQHLGLSSKIHIIDTIAGDTRLGALSAADLFVLTSYNENFGMSVVEAMATATPVIISDKVGIAREIAQDNAGYVVKLNVDAIQSALRELFTNDSMRLFYGQRGRLCTLARYDTSIVTQQMVTAYQSVLKVPSVSRVVAVSG